MPQDVTDALRHPSFPGPSPVVDPAVPDVTGFTSPGDLIAPTVDA